MTKPADARAGQPSFAYLFERFPSFVQTFCYREAEEMVGQGMHPLIVSIRRPEDPPELAESLRAEVLYLPEEKELRAEVDRRRAARALPWRAHRAIPRHRAEADAQRMFEAIYLGPILREKGIRHVHAHFGGLAARTAWWLRRLYGIRYSFTGHANDIFVESGTPVTNAMLAHDATFIVTETDFARKWYEQRHPRARGKTFRVFNGISLSGFPPPQPAPGPPRIVSVGRYVEKKGYRVLLEACRLLRDRGLSFECLLVGGGPLAEELQQQITAARLDGTVQLLGPRSQPEVRSLIASAHLFVLACVREAEGGSDNLPTVIMEAMACGVPVLSTHLAGVPEMITDGVDGRLVPPGDPAALAGAMQEMLASPTAAAALAGQGRQAAAERFDLRATTRHLKHLLVKHAAVVPPPAARQADPALPPVPRWRQVWSRLR